MRHLLASVLRGESTALGGLGGLAAAVVVEGAEREGVLPLLAEALKNASGACPQLEDLLRPRARAEAAADLVRHRELERLVLALSDVPFVLIKGAHLAYAHYPRPDLRPRTDTDVLVPRHAADAAGQRLLQAGYGSVPQAGGNLVSYQAGYALSRDGAVAHLVDLHWRLTNPQAFGGVLAFEEIAAEAAGVPGLAPATGPSIAHAVIVACVHRVAHHRSVPRLLWAYDLHRLAAACTGSDWERLAMIAAARGLGAIVWDALDESRRLFGTAVPAGVARDARFRSPAPIAAARAVFVTPDRPHAAVVLADLRALPRWRDRMRLVRQHLLPSPEYMRTVYAPDSRLPLPFLYLRRAWRGAFRWFERPLTP